MTTPGVRQRQQFGWDATEVGGRREKKEEGEEIRSPHFYSGGNFCGAMELFVSRMVRSFAALTAEHIDEHFCHSWILRVLTASRPRTLTVRAEYKCIYFSIWLCIPQEKKGSQICPRLCLAKSCFWTPMQMYTQSHYRYLFIIVDSIIWKIHICMHLTATTLMRDWKKSWGKKKMRRMSHRGRLQCAPLQSFINRPPACFWHWLSKKAIY